MHPRVNIFSDAVVVMTKIVVRVTAEKPLRSPDHPGYISESSMPTASTSASCASSRDASSSGRSVSGKSDIPPCIDLSLEFKNLTYNVQHTDVTCRACKSRGKTVHDRRSLDLDQAKILHSISGIVKGGEIMAVMGPSGSGKSTLIDALAQRISGESLQGSITLNGEEVKSNGIIRSISAYVMQDDLLFPMLTVNETLRFAAELCLPNSRAEKNARVDDVLLQLNLSQVANTIIGDEAHRGISGGERRRVSIGKEIVHDPLLLFLDEPTSGLDSTNALLVVSTLKNIARSGSVVVLSVHQPSDRILSLFTTLLFISEGQTIYRGPPGGIRQYFETYLGHTIPEGTNATEYVLDLVQEFHMGHRTGVTPLVQAFSKFVKETEYQSALISADHVPSTDVDDPESFLPSGVRGALAGSIARGKLIGATGYLTRYNASPTSTKQFANSRMYETYVLACRGILNNRRTPELFLMRFLTVMISGFILATIFWKLDHSPQGLKERLGFCAFATSTTFYICVDTLPIFLQERHIFMRETAHDSYRISSYVLAIVLINIPFLFLLSFAFSITTFWTVGLSGGPGGYFFFLIIVWASFWAGNSFATLLSAIISNVITGYTVVVAALAYFLLLSGFFISRNRIPYYWLWLHYLSVIKYPYEAILLNEFESSSSSTQCFETGDQILFGTPFAGSDVAAEYVLNVLRPFLQSTTYRDLNGSTCVINGSAVLRSQGIGEISKWGCLAITVGFGVFYRLLFYVFLRVSGKTKRS